MNIDQIIGKLMGDGSIGEEKSALEAWKKEAEDNIKALVDIQKIASLSDSLHGYEDFSTDEAWDSFERELNDQDDQIEEKKTKTTRVFSIATLGRIAAILIVVFGCVFVFNQYSSTGAETKEAIVYTANAENLEFELQDGSQITLDKKAELKVNEDRDVTLNGRAHFDIARDESKQFKIKLQVGEIVVLGTQFTVDSDANSTEIHVTEGSVQYSLGDQTYILVEGDLVKVVNNEVTKLKSRDDNYDSWKNKRLMFRDNNMVEVVDALSRHFRKDIIIDDKKSFAECNVVNVFDNATLFDILNDLSKSHGLKYEIRDEKIHITSANC